MTTFATQPTQTTSATPPANVTITQEAASNTPTIIGEAIGAVFGAVFVAILIWIFCRKKRYHQEDNEHQGRMRRIKESWLPKVFQSSQAQSSAHPIQISTPIPMMAQKTPPRPGRPASLTESTVHAMSSSPVSYGRNTSENMPMPNDYYGTGRGDQPRSAPDAARYQTPPPRVPRPASSMYSQQPYSGPRFRGNNDHPTDIGYAIDETIDSIRGSAGPSSPRPYRESVGSLELDYDSEYEESPHRPRVAHEQRYTAFALPPVPAFRRDEDEQDQDKVRRERQRAMEQLEGRRGPQYYYNG
ncbi:hypothetical protein BDZ45DRAFT_668247 [Acephala macrosclerotiorum]|nr:hypothetical protein BDZ45DRAFT_668247 [Acephala macrosclerotiorum]